jgi:hypothetical protein
MEKEVKVNGTLVLVLGILGLALCLVAGIIGAVCGLIAWSLGDSALKKLKAAEIHDGADRTNALIGRTCGVMAALIYLGTLIVIWLR